MNSTITPELALRALRIVFDQESVPSADLAMLAGLSQRDLAARFRVRALELHPDRAGTLGQPQDVLERQFKRLHGAYRVLSRLVEDERLCVQIVQQSRTRTASDERRHTAPTDTGVPRAKTRPASGTYYHGRVPESKLRFAQFLYYNRVIDWRTMIDAITWQYRVRPKLGEIGRAYRFLDFDSVTRVLRASPQGELFGDTAVKLGVLDQGQLCVALGKQHRFNYPIGRYFLEKDILSRVEIEHLLQQNRRHNLKYRR